jgi:hypothetical protein
MKNFAFYLLAIIGIAGYRMATDVERDESGSIVDSGTVDVFQIKAGDCFDDSIGFGDEISSLPGVPCSEPHDNEAYAAFDLTTSTYTDEESMWEMAHNACLERFETFVGRDYETSTLDIFSLYPTADSWANGDREVVCAVYDMEESKLVGSVQGRGL